ncbi:hypothetical protein AB9P05_19385 [Roseivirga sp. BDSF3-8]|uniref:hypothetical protein n=1 Tax=Roseivirga sp. BDSF3-8 TaxID=3241598 RepID=UPI0035323E1C
METTETYKLILYASYLVITIPIIWAVGNRLFTNGFIFLEDVFERREMAESINKLLITGFYLIMVGYSVKGLSNYSVISDIPRLLEVLSGKVGGLLLILGVIHLLNMFFFFFIRKRYTASRGVTKAERDVTA